MEYKRAMLASVWGEMESDEDGDSGEEVEVEVETILCLHTLETKSSQTKLRGNSHICLMGKSGCDSEDDEVSFRLMKNQVKTLPKEQMIKYFEESLDTCREQTLEIDYLKEQIEEIMEENVLLKRKVKKLSSKVTVCQTITSDPEVIVQQTIISDLKLKNEELLRELTSMNHEMEEYDFAEVKNLRQENKSLKSEVSKVHLELTSLKSRENVGSNSFEAIEKENNELKSDLDKAIRFFKKWEGSTEVLNFLNLQTDNNIKKGLGYPLDGNRNVKKLSPSEQDFRKRKYVDLPEYLTCTFCGKSGHEKPNCIKMKNAVNQNNKHIPKQDWLPKHASNHSYVYQRRYVKPNPEFSYIYPTEERLTKPKVIKKIWIRKDLLASMTHAKGPNLIWVPKNRN